MAKTAAADAVILIPSLEPDERLPKYIRDLMESGFRRAVIVDDGSSEKYQPIFREIEGIDGAAVLHHEVNKGKGEALKTGYRYIQETMPEITGVITADADGQHAVKDCIRLAEKLEDGQKALYLGSRDFGKSNVPFKSSLGNRATSVLFLLLYGHWVSDTQTGLRAFRREEIPLMISVEGSRFEYEMNVLISCSRNGIPIIPVEIETIYENENKGSHYHPLKDSMRIFRVMAGNFVRFMGASMLCFLLDQGLAAVLREWLLPLAGLEKAGFMNVNISGWGARVVSAIVNFRLNKDLVFKLKGNAKNAAWKYAVLCVVIICLSNAGVWLLGKIGMAGWLAKLLMDFCLYFVSYRVQAAWVFREDEAA